MSAYLKTFSRLGVIVTLILLAITLLKQLISLVGFLLFAVKVATLAAFVGLLLLIGLAIFRGRGRRRREMEDL